MSGIPIGTIGSQARFWSRQCKDEKTAMLLNYVAVGCMVMLAGTALLHYVKESNKDRQWNRVNNGWDR
jgi:hypothetical protein